MAGEGDGNLIRMAAPLIPGELNGLFERLDHLALAVRDIRNVVPLLDLMGGTYRTGGIHPRDGFRWVQFDLAAGPKIELLSPLDPDDASHFLNRFFADRGEGPHHVTFKVADIRQAIDSVRALGYDVVGENLDNGSWREAFVHPKSSHGLLIQLAEWDDTRPPASRRLEDVLDAGRP